MVGVRVREWCLGFPLTDETSTPNGKGRYNTFELGSIHWSAKTGAHETEGRIRDKWAGLGWEGGVLGFPVTDETSTPNGKGRYNSFEHGSIHWSLATDAHETQGRIRDKRATLGWEAGVLGFPTTHELTTPNGRGKYNMFEHGSIHWSLATDAHETQGRIQEKWAELGWEGGFLGFPLTDETSTPIRNGKYNTFEHGSIHWSPATGAHETHGAIRDKWGSLGWESGPLGFRPATNTRPPWGVGRTSRTVVISP